MVAIEFFNVLLKLQEIASRVRTHFPSGGLRHRRREEFVVVVVVVFVNDNNNKEDF